MATALCTRPGSEPDVRDLQGRRGEDRREGRTGDRRPGPDIAEIDRQIRESFRTHPQAKIIKSLPIMGPILGAEFIAAAVDLAHFPDPGRLATYAGLAPVPSDSGLRTGNLHRPKRCNRTLLRASYLAAQSAMMRPGPWREYHLRKRFEGCNHTQAILALARRRVDVLWALLRDNQPYAPIPACAQAA
jgi:transposase